MRTYLATAKLERFGAYLQLPHWHLIIPIKIKIHTMDIDLSQAKDIAAIAVPFAKAIVDEFITPNVKRLVKKKGVVIQMTGYSFENHFE